MQPYDWDAEGDWHSHLDPESGAREVSRQAEIDTLVEGFAESLDRWLNPAVSDGFWQRMNEPHPKGVQG